MQAFRKALSDKYGMFGEHAFDTVLGSRQQLKKSLRACDIKTVLANINHIKRQRFISEMNRQLDTDPLFLELSSDLRKAVRHSLHENAFGRLNLRNCKSQEQLSLMVSERIKEVVESERETAENDLLGRKLDTKNETIDTNLILSMPKGRGFLLPATM